MSRTARCLLVSVLLGSACAVPPQGLRATPPGTGPLVRVDWDAEPLPDIPFPNDLATRPDPSSPTGLRLNLPLQADVALERTARIELNKLSGAGIYAPIVVSFEGPLDVGALLARHPDDHEREHAFDDDAVYLIDVDPASPDFGRPVALDLGGGRFPMDRTHEGGYLSFDPRADQPALLFETAEEDLDADGQLDPGEDTDGDGLLDHPNVWPPGGDPRQDLLTFYAQQSSTLMVRPVLPLREQTRYAVVLTSALASPSGQPVRSPWPWVNHTRQTDALQPVIDAMEALGRSVDDIAFAWTFTTGEVTTELWQVAEGVRGRGPFAWLADAVPAGVREAHHLHTLPDQQPTFLPVEQILAPLSLIGYLPAESVDILDDSYGTFASNLVGGTFLSPNLLVGADGESTDDPDARWDLDPSTGRAVMRPRSVAFSCILPKAGDGIEPPWPIAIHAHGYGSTRVEFIGFAHALTRHGIAVCGLDAPGHGLPLGPDDIGLVADLLELTQTEPLWWHLLADRRRDLNNDGLLDTAGDIFTADAFHTRDMIRQGVVDWAQLIETLRGCGTGRMEQVRLLEGGPLVVGEPLVTCDFDADGSPDLGGPDTRFVLEGISQGGIMTGLSVAVNPADTAALTVPGGGLADIGGRTDISAVRDAMIGRSLSPLVVAEPGPDGLVLSQRVISVDREVTLPIATLPDPPFGGRLVVRNLALGRSAEMPLAAGPIRVPIAANALNPGEKRRLLGIPAEGPGEDEYSVPDNEGLGDRLEIEVFDAQGRSVALFDRWGGDVLHEGVIMRADSPLVAGSWGLGLRRGSKDLLRLVSTLAIAVEPGDPIAYARRWADEPFDQPKNVLIHLTVGDTTVPAATGVALARAAGLVPFDRVDPRYGTSADRFLIERGVVDGQEQHGPWRDGAGVPLLFDPDDLDSGTDGTGAPSESPLRAQRPTATGLHALRFLYVDPHGTHAYFLPDQSQAFDWELFSVQQMAAWLASGGVEVVDDPCLAGRDCPFLRPMGEGAVP
jgi:hypothetical protein